MKRIYKIIIIIEIILILTLIIGYIQYETKIINEKQNNALGCEIQPELKEVKELTGNTQKPIIIRNEE